MTQDERAIRQVVDAWMTDDVVFMAPGQPPFGKEAFAAAARQMGGVDIDAASEIVELRLLQDWAFTGNRIQPTRVPREGAQIRRSGYALTLLRKEADGQWRVARDANLVTRES